MPSKILTFVTVSTHQKSSTQPRCHVPQDVNSGFRVELLVSLSEVGAGREVTHMCKINTLVAEVLAKLKHLSELSNDHLLEDCQTQESVLLLQILRPH